MPIYTVEATYRVPVYRQRTYHAATPANACRQAIEDDDWSNDKLDYEAAGETHVTGIWLGDAAAYSGATVPIPSHFAAVAKAEAILAGARDPDQPGAAPRPVHILAQIQEDRVRDQIAAIIETDPDFASLTTDAVSDGDIHAACLSVAANTDLAEEIGAAEFRAALAALRAGMRANGG